MFSTISELPAPISEFSVALAPLPNTGTSQIWRFWPGSEPVPGVLDKTDIIRWVAAPIGTIFLNLLFMLVVPLLFSALVLGIGGLGDLRSLGRIGLKTLAYTVVVSAIAVFLGVLLVNVMRPGEGVSEADRAELMRGLSERAGSVTGAAAPKAGIDLLLGIVPRNPIAAMASASTSSPTRPRPRSGSRSARRTIVSRSASVRRSRT